MLVILAAISIPFIGYDTGIRCIKAPCPSFAYTSVWKYLFLMGDNPYAQQSMTISWLRFGLGLLAWYFVLSLISHIVKKFLATPAKSI